MAWLAAKGIGTNEIEIEETVDAFLGFFFLGAPFLLLVPVVIFIYLHHWITVGRSPWLRPGASSLWEGLYALQVLFTSVAIVMLPLYYLAIVSGLVMGLRSTSTAPPGFEAIGIVASLLAYLVAAYLYHVEALAKKPRPVKEPSKRKRQTEIDRELTQMKRAMPRVKPRAK